MSVHSHKEDAMKRKIISIDEKLCNGCGLCIPGCPEGALQLIDGKARLVGDYLCDGLGACIGECPQGAITIEEREAQPYDERTVIQSIIEAGPATIKAHLQHLKDHGELVYLSQALEALREKGIEIPQLENKSCSVEGGCPGSATKKIEPVTSPEPASNQPMPSMLRTWPVQLHLINPSAPYLHNADLLISADCVPFAYADFHRKFVKDKVVITLCPKLDTGIDRYIEKLAEIFRTQDIKSLTIVRMEVPCCGGIEVIVRKALELAGKTIFVRLHIVTINGNLS